MTTTQSSSFYNNSPSVFPVTDYGALGDGANDDTAAVNLAIVAAIAAGGGTVFFPRGVYKCTSTISLPVTATLALVGEAAGWHRPISQVQFTQTDGTSGFKLDGSVGRSVESSFFMYGLYINGNNSLGPCFEMISYSWATFEHVMTDRGSYGMKISSSYINRFENCKFYRAVNDGVYINAGNENNFTDCHVTGCPGYGVNIVDGNINIFTGDYSLNDTGQFWIQRGQNNDIHGYMEADISNLAVKFGKYTSYNRVDAWTAEMYFIDEGFGNTYPAGQSCRPVDSAFRAASVANLVPDSSFTESVGSWFSTAATLSQDTTTGVTTGTCMKITADTTAVNAQAQSTVVAGGQVADEDVFSISGWVKASKVMTREGTYFRAGLNLGGTGNLYPVHYTIPYADTNWRPFEFCARVEYPTVTEAMNAHFIIANPTSGDWVKVTDLQIIRNPPKSVDPLKYPYHRNGLTVETFGTISGAQRDSDSSASPGNATINLLRGKSAIAAGASAATITNNKVLALDTVIVQDESGDATGIRLKVVPGAGSFVVTCLDAAGTPTNATANLKFSWYVLK